MRAPEHMAQDTWGSAAAPLMGLEQGRYQEVGCSLGQASGPTKPGIHLGWDVAWRPDVKGRQQGTASEVVD